MIPKYLKKYFSPALLVYSRKEALKKLDFINEQYSHSRVHVDVLDGKFVPSTCWCKPSDYRGINIQQSFEVHLMALHPERRISAWKRAGTSRIIFHYEATSNPLRVIDTIEKHRLQSAIALNLETSPKVLELLVDRLDAILFMSIAPGWTGQPFQKSVIQKIRSFHKKYPKKCIIVDGGVSETNAPLLINAGAGQLVSTSAIYGSPTYARQ